MKYLRLIIPLLFIATKLSAQEPKEVINSISVTIFDEHIAYPFGARSDSPTHLGGTISFETSKKRYGMYQFTHIFQGGYYYHKNFNQVAFIAWKPKFELRFFDLINANILLGIGYAHSFPTQPTYKFENGSYKRSKNYGKPHFMPSIGFGGGLKLDKLIGVPIEVFARYEAFSLAPYATKGRIPLTLNTMTSFGITYSFN